jgi:lipopolysaccharide transport system ATP-binding protein
MSDSVISVESLGKKYRIRHQAEGQRYVALRDVLADHTKSVARRLWSAARNPWSRGPVASGPRTEDFWALRDVSFKVQRGETLGIIGRNGAGKSTLLKVLSRITEPTEGRVRIKGRVASLLEVGTGFHPELTGRENIFLNGAILGMSRAEIRSKFDQIVMFSGVERFLDTPVKRYSSGMHVRLAFSVAAHLEPEVLVVDEVLAVGDAEFQKKCLGKMEEVSQKEGRTVLFVSHNMTAISKLCSRCILLGQGKLEADGSPEQTVSRYFAMVSERPAGTTVGSRSDREGLGALRFTDMQIQGLGGTQANVAIAGSELSILLSIRNTAGPGDVGVHIAVLNVEGEKLLHLSNTSRGCVLRLENGVHHVSCSVPRLPLVQGTHSLNIALTDSSGALQDRIERASIFEVLNGDYFGTGKITEPNGAKFHVDHTWCALQRGT